MRWPFHRRKAVPPADTRDGQPLRHSAGQAPPLRRDWTNLPPIPSVATAEAPITVPARRFVATLATRQSLISPPVAKSRSASAPGGLVHVAPLEVPALPSKPSRAQPASSDEGEQWLTSLQASQAAILTPLPPFRRVRPSTRSTASIPDPLAVAEVAPIRPPQMLEASAIPAEPDNGTALDEADSELAGPSPRTEPPALRLVEPPPSNTPESAPSDTPEAAPSPEQAPPTDAHPSRSRKNRSNLAESRRLGLGPAYHGPLPEAIRLAHADRAALLESTSDSATDTVDEDGAGASDVESVPDDVRTEMRTAYGVDVDKVHRGPEASDEARELGARAFARAGEMFVPPEAGRLDTPEGKSIVAHELTHVSQQRRTGGLLPQEDSLAGQALEAEAQEAERFFRGDAGAPRPGSRQKSGDSDVVNGSKSTKSSKSNAATDDSGISEAQAMMGKLVSEGLAVSDGGGGIVFTQPAPRGSSTGVQRQITAAPPVMQSGSPTQTPTNLNPFETLASGVSQDRTGFGHDMLTTGVAVVQGVQAEIALALNETERDLAVREFRDLRLEHRKTQFLTEQEQSTLSSDDEQTLELEVQEEVDRRLLELESRVNMRLDVMNPQRSADQGVPAGQASEEGGAQSPALHPDQYQVVVRRLFGNPESPIPPDDTSDVSTPAVRGLVQRGTTQAGPDQSSPTGEGAGPGSTGGSGTGAMPARVAGRVADQGTGVGWAMRSPRTAAQAPSEIFRPDRGGGVGAATGALPAVAEISSDLARYTAGTSAAETTARAPFPDTTTGPPFAETAISTPVAEAPGRVAEFATAGVQSIGAGAVGQEAVGSSGHEQLDLDHLDLDELSARIYGRLRRRLRAELLIDRERAGLLTDFR